VDGNIINTELVNQLNLKAPLDNPTFTGTVTGITKSMVGLENVDNTSDLLKPISTATQTALDLKANLNNPTFTGTITAPTINASTALQINGTSTATLYAPKPWVQCIFNGGNMTFQSSSLVGRVTPTITRTSGQAAGAYDVSFTTHPNASNYTHSIQVRTDSGFATGVISNVFGNSCKIRLYNASQVLTDYQFSLIIFA
jgi:hypothetical protein